VRIVSRQNAIFSGEIPFFISIMDAELDNLEPIVHTRNQEVILARL